MTRRTVRQRPELFRRSDSQPVDQEDVQASKRIKVTVYLQPDDVVAVDELQIAEFKRTGKKPEKSEIVSRAIQLLRQSDS